MDATGVLTSIIMETNFRELPSKAVEIAKYAVIDYLGVALAGSNEPLGRIIAEFVAGTGGEPQAGVLGHGFRTSAPQAALANGTMGHALDYDDSTVGVGHTGVCVFPCLLALGEILGVSGKDILTAYVVGFEVACRLGKTMGTAHYDKGWHDTSTLGCMGAAAAGANLLNLDENQARMALGIAASHASGLRANFGTMTKPLHAGNAARIGVESALLASKGFTADKGIIDANFGYLPVLSMGESEDLSKLTETAEGGFYILKGVYTKLFASCYATQRPITAMLELVQENNITANEVESMEVVTLPIIPKALVYTEPKTGIEGKFSLQYTLAAALLDRKVTLKTFTDEMVLRPEAQKLFSKVRVKVDPTLDRERHFPGGPNNLTVRLKDGRQYTKYVEMVKGHPALPLSRADMVEKYRDCASLVIPGKSVEHSLELLEHLEDLADVRELMNLVTG